MQSQGSDSVGTRAEPWIGLALCVAVVLGWAWEQTVPNPDGPQAFAPDWLPLAAAGIAAAGIIPLGGSPRWLRMQRALSRQPPPAGQRVVRCAPRAASYTVSIAAAGASGPNTGTNRTPIPQRCRSSLPCPGPDSYVDDSRDRPSGTSATRPGLRKTLLADPSRAAVLA